MLSKASAAIKRRFKARYNAEDRNNFVFCYLLLLIPVAHFALFWVYVNINSILLAFQDQTGNWTLGNFKELFQAFASEDMYGWNLGQILLRTVTLWGIVNVICTPLIIFSTFILFKRIKGHYIFRTIFAIPSILGAIIWTRLISFLVNADGPILQLALRLGMQISEEVLHNGLIANSATAFPTLIFINVIPHLIACNLVLTGAFSRIPPEIFESGKLDGVRFIREFTSFGIPLVWPTLVISFISALSTIFTSDGGVFLYTMGNFDTATMGFYLYYMVYRISNSFIGANAFGYPAAVGLLLTLMTLPIILISRYFFDRMFKDVEF